MTTGASMRRTGVQLLFPHDSDHVRAARCRSTSPPRSSSATSRSTSRWTSTRSSGSSTWRCTRARDHLVVSVHRTERTLPDDRPKWTHAELLWAAARRPRRTGPSSTPPLPTIFCRARERPRSRRVPYPAWSDVARAARPCARGRRRRRGVVRHRASRPRRPSAPRRADPGLAKDARDLELPPWNKGRYGTAVGRAVHAVLQTVDLVTGDRHRRDRRRAGRGRGRDRSGARHRRARPRALASTHGARGGRHRRLLARDVRRHPGGGAHARGLRRPRLPHAPRAWSWSTTRPTRGATSPISTPRSRATGSRARAYAVALEAATGEPVARCVFLFLGAGGADERAVSDLPQALEEVRALLSASAGSG